MTEDVKEIVCEFYVHSRSSCLSSDLCSTVLCVCCSLGSACEAEVKVVHSCDSVLGRRAPCLGPSVSQRFRQNLPFLFEFSLEVGFDYSGMPPLSRELRGQC